MHEASDSPTALASSTDVGANLAKPARSISRTWFLIGIAAVLLGLAMGLIMSTLSS